MRQVLTVFLVAAACAAAPAAAANWEPIEKLPGCTPVVLRVKEKERVYFRVTPPAPLVVSMQGPVRLRVISRAEFTPGSPPVVSYRLRAASGDVALNLIATETSASDRARLIEGGAPVGKSRRMVLDVPAGKHAVALSAEGVPSVLVRLMRGPAAPGPEPLVSLTPVGAPRSVSLSEGEKTIAYYSVLPGEPVRLRVAGPTTLDLAARLDYDSTMRGTQIYRLGLSEKGQRLRVLDFRTTKAASARYTELTDRAPSKLNRAHVRISKGLHEISVELLLPKQGAAEVHARIPQPTVGNEE